MERRRRPHSLVATDRLLCTLQQLLAKVSMTKVPFCLIYCFHFPTGKKVVLLKFSKLQLLLLGDELPLAFQPGMAREILNWEPVGPTLLTRVDSSGKTPLQFAILYRRLDVVEMFLDDHTSSEQAHISDNHGLFPVHSAAKVGSTRIIDVLIQKCPDYCELLDDKGRSLLHCAVEHNQESVVRHVCQNGTFVTLLNAMDSEGNTPLHLAVKYGCPRIVSLLLQTMSVKTGITNKDGLTAGDLAHRVLERGRMNYFLVILLNCIIVLLRHCIIVLFLPASFSVSVSLLSYTERLPFRIRTSTRILYSDFLSFTELMFRKLDHKHTISLFPNTNYTRTHTHAHKHAHARTPRRFATH